MKDEKLVLYADSKNPLSFFAMKITRYALKSKHTGEFLRLAPTTGLLTWSSFSATAASYDSATEAAITAITLGIESHVTIEAVR